jgi:hypothetical protein
MVARRFPLPLLAFVFLSLWPIGCTEMTPHRMAKPDPGPLPLTPPPQIATPPATPGPVAAADFRVPAQPVQGTAALRALYQRAAEQHRAMDSYIFRLRRREVVGGKNRPEELILVKFRQDPWSVYFKWLGPEAKGREAVYVKGRPGNEIHTLTAAGDVPLLPAGQRFSISADSPLVKGKSRYPITEAGLGSTIRKFGALVEAAEKGDTRPGTLKYLGRVKRPEFEEAVEGVEQTVPPQSDPLLPGGGRRWWYFETARGLPALIVTHDETGREVEYYCHDRIQAPVRLDEDDFNPDKLWKKVP